MAQPESASHRANGEAFFQLFLRKSENMLKSEKNKLSLKKGYNQPHHLTDGYCEN